MPKEPKMFSNIAKIFIAIFLLIGTLIVFDDIIRNDLRCRQQEFTGDTAQDSSIIESTAVIGTLYLSFRANVSAYCPCEKCCDKWADGVTASGHIIQPGDKFVAAPDRYPFGIIIDIPGYGEVPVLDRGGAIKGDKLDVFFPTHQEAVEWGRQYLMVKIMIEKQKRD